MSHNNYVILHQYMYNTDITTKQKHWTFLEVDFIDLVT